MPLRSVVAPQRNSMNLPQKVYGMAKGVVNFTADRMNDFTDATRIPKYQGEAADAQRKQIIQSRESRANEKAAGY